MSEKLSPDDSIRRLRTLFSLEHRAADDQRLLRKELQSWCSAHRADAALYVTEEGSPSLFLRVGDSGFPGEPPTELPVGWKRIELPGAVLVTTAAGELQAHDPHLLLLAAGSRISSLKHKIHEHSFQAKFRGVELEALYEVGLAIASTLDFEELCEEVLLRAIALLDARRGALYLLEEDEYRLHRTIGGAARESFATREIDLSAGGAGPEDWIPESKHLLAVPIDSDGNRRGLLVVADKESRRGVGPFPPTDRRTLSLFANQAAIALENARLHKLALDKERLEREMELAAEIQQQILPKVKTTIPGFEVAGWNRPARQVGGDYFDIRPLPEGHFALVVGDVTGKGMPAALLVSTLHSALRLLFDRVGMGAELAARLNRHVCESSSVNKFITLLLAALDSRERRLTYINAGHNPGILLRGDGEAETLGSGGLPLGLLPDAEYVMGELELRSGDLLCLYSDGITECEGDDEEEFGLERLIEVLRVNRERPLEEIITTIDQATADFARGRPQGDDQTVVLLRCCSSREAATPE